MGCVQTAAGRKIWLESSVQVYSVRRFDRPPAGRTGKGVLHVYEYALTNKGYNGRVCGQARSFDVEDIIQVTSRNPLTTK